MSDGGELRRPFVTSTLPQPKERDPATFYGRVVVLLVLASIIIVSVIAISIGKYFDGQQEYLPPQERTVGSREILVSQQLPPSGLVLIALAAIAVIAIVAISFEVTAALMSISPRRRLLSELRGQDLMTAEPGRRVRVTVLVPAHNEEYSLPTTLAALAKQTRPPDRVIVVADNCTDRTVEIAHEMGHEAFESVNNVHKKGGALNQVLAAILPVAGPQDVILVMDADTSLGPRYLEVATQRMEADPELAAVGGVFFGEEGHGVIGQFQRNEYTRYSLQIKSRRGRVFVLTGTATVFRASALIDVAAARGVFIPGEPGLVYDTAALTEDNELTIALKSLGATMVSPPECYVVTELMPAWRNLWIQRQRWQRGALENLAAYGMTRATIRYWGQQLGIGYGTIALNASMLLFLITIISLDRWIWFPFWIIIGGIFWLERVITSWKGGWRARLLAALLLPELCYDIFLQAVFVSCLWDISLGRQATWGHVQHPAAKT
ncbi:MAG: glycosyltransferase family 2 protein [Candidatus Nanopelagicales bacterium]|nr:glycosyltransferase family 2 protein [Candidatus Nanopelagicales bacterium]